MNGRQLPPKFEDVDGLGNPFQMHAPAIDVRNPLQPACEMYDTVGRDHFTRTGEPAEARRDVEGRTAEASVDPDRLARVDPNADVEGHRRIGPGLLFETHLQFDSRSQGLAGRTEDGERFVSPYLDDRAAASRDSLAGDRGKSRREPCGSFVATFLGEPRIPADVSDQESPDLGVRAEKSCRALVRALRSWSRPIDNSV
jgi:hypothetical protein